MVEQAEAVNRVAGVMGYLQKESCMILENTLPLLQQEKEELRTVHE